MKQSINKCMNIWIDGWMFLFPVPGGMVWCPVLVPDIGLWFACPPRGSAPGKPGISIHHINSPPNTKLSYSGKGCKF